MARTLGHIARLLLVTLCAAALTAPGAARGQTAGDAPPADGSAAASGAGGGGATAVPASRQAKNVAVIPITGMIDRYTVYSVERRMELAERGGAGALVFELDTPGGEVGAVLEICNLIKASPIPNTVAWVNPDAYSGGAIIALACREIVVAPYATMGDAAPVTMNPIRFAQGLAETERQKILQPLISEVVDSARRRGYSEYLVQAFLRLGVELWLIENTETGERVFVTDSEYREVFGEAPPEGSPRVASGVVEETERAERDVDLSSPANQELDSTRPDLSRADPSAWTLVEYVADGESLLVLKTEDLIRYGLAVEKVADDQALKAFFGAENLRRVNPTWSESLVRFLSSMWIRGLLIAVMLLAAFIEFTAPGLGLAGGVAGVCLLLLIGPPVLIGAAAWWAYVAILVGFALIAVEIFALPGFGVFGIGGLAALFAGLLGTIVGPGGLFPDSPNEQQDLLYGVVTVLLAVFSAGIGMYFVARHHGSLPIVNRLVLGAERDDEESGAGLLSAMGEPESESAVNVGDVGVATTSLRPSGSAEFEGRLHDVVAERGFVDRGERVRVVSATRYRIGVERTGEGETA